MKSIHKIIPLLDRDFGSSESYLTELAVRAHNRAYSSPSSSVSRWIN